jgi:hypothetical protein
MEAAMWYIYRRYDYETDDLISEHELELIIDSWGEDRSVGQSAGFSVCGATEDGKPFPLTKAEKRDIERHVEQLEKSGYYERGY